MRINSEGVHTWLVRVLGVVLLAAGVFASIPAFSLVEEAWLQGATGAPAKAVIVGAVAVVAAILIGFGAVTIALARPVSDGKSPDDDS